MKNEYHNKTWHIFHILMCLLTSFFWTPIYVWRIYVNNTHNEKIDVAVKAGLTVEKWKSSHA
jgi:hypothetical protein